MDHPIDSKGCQQSQVSDGMKEDEVVRCMSNLPSFLEKGKNFQEKALNVGVIDWKYLEKWHYSKKHLPRKYTGYSPSSSSTSSYTDDGSLSHSYSGQSHSPMEASVQENHVQDAKSSIKRGQNGSPSHRKMEHSVLQSHSQKAYASGGNSRVSINSTVGTGNLSQQAKALGAIQECQKKQSTSKSVSAIVPPLILNTCEVKILGNEPAKEALTLQETEFNDAYREISEREISGIIIKPTYRRENFYSDGILSEFKISDHKPGWMVFSGINKGEDPSPSKNDNTRHLDTTGARPCDAEAVKNSSEASPFNHTKLLQSPLKISTHRVKAPSQASLPLPARRFCSPPRSRRTEEKKPIEIKSSESIPRSRNPSPIRRLSYSVSRMIKSSGSRGNSPLRRSCSTDGVDKHGSEGAASSVTTYQTCGERSLNINNNNSNNNNNNRGRSSPLRRLLDPLLKPKASSSPEPSKKYSSSTVTSSSMKGSTSLQALLQVSFKNGLPLFTFAIDNESNILAATVRKSYVPGKGHYTWTYTFFTIHEVKVKSGNWLNHGGRGNGHGYMPNVVAQMKVSDSPVSPVTEHQKVDEDITREFDLFAVELGNGDQHATDFHSTSELAAIIAKLPRVATRNLSKAGQSTYSWLDLSLAFVREKFPETTFCNDSDNNLQNFQNMNSQNFSTTVVLPGGVHTIPSRGEISTLAHRWRSGGSCDCGGWDLGCQLRVYTNQIGQERKMGSSAACADEHKFQLFSPAGQDNMPMLNLALFKERIYSVEFSSSLSHLQAFAICLSFIDCRRPAELSGPSIVVEKVSNEVGDFEVPVQMKTSNHEAEVLARYVSYPPHSPVGRA